ncbi:Putative flippase GtrA (transmembrane translocase of bactoprenol-linked glucose) [Catalinimonas alkaloidigena]|uniref:Putative flippase GtrA (Transmembrane translocase of bactoprenol-linked glucose) n=1 Tax=Catalinimonas alkaloidigena TaxID=1075417 RepID=A0A1G9JCQ3_9BACT|nr:GtrA family protein [Catalinimonas alkaloidigena]SDL35072.1 Putative flippase GtrA (transmembrane translocase of bactoprenol-linked glucose) [Catalinimonas alkaloidigena]
MQHVIARSHLRQIIGFFVAGLVCAAIEFAILVGLVETLQLNPLVANPFAILVATVLNYFLSRWWVFESGRYSRRKEFVAFMVFSVLGFVLNQGLMWAFVDGLDINYKFGKVLAIGGAAVFNFITKKYLVFKG